MFHLVFFYLFFFLYLEHLCGLHDLEFTEWSTSYFSRNRWRSGGLDLFKDSRSHQQTEIKFLLSLIHSAWSEYRVEDHLFGIHLKIFISSVAGLSKLKNYNSGKWLLAPFPHCKARTPWVIGSWLLSQWTATTCGTPLFISCAWKPVIYSPTIESICTVE